MTCTTCAALQATIDELRDENQRLREDRDAERRHAIRAEHAAEAHRPNRRFILP